MMEQKSTWRMRLGITRDNPFARFAVILTVLSTIALIILFYFIFAGNTAKDRFNAGIAFMVVGALALILIVLLTIYARNFARIQAIVAGSHWAHWQYYKSSLGVKDVYISPEGIYYPDQRFTLNTFSNGLQKVEIPPDQPSVLRFNYLYVRHWGSHGEVSNYDKTIVVPILAGKEDEAQALVQRFQSQLGKRSSFIVDQIRMTWVMLLGIVVFLALWFIFVAMPLEASYDAEKIAKQKAETSALDAKQLAELSPMLIPIRKVIDSQIERLKISPDGQMTAKEAGFDESAGVNKVLYGHCPPDKDFYVFVVLKKDVLGRSYLGGTGTFNYTTKTGQRYSYCGPERVVATVPLQLADGWYYGDLEFVQSTPTPRIVITATPTATTKPSLTR